MFELNIPVGDFLQRALRASIAQDFEAFLLIVARSADSPEVLSEVVDHWESFDDLTYDQILVVSPRSAKHGGSAFVPHWRDPVGLTTHGLSFGNRPTGRWNGSFWGRTSTRPPSMGMHAPRRPKSRKEQIAAFTAATTETARFFGIPERCLPCIVILALRQRRLFVVSIRDHFSLYDFVRCLLIEHEPFAERSHLAAERFEEVERDRKTLVAKLQQVHRRLNEVDRKEYRLREQWAQQIDSMCRHLDMVSRQSTICSTEARCLANWLKTQDAEIQFEEVSASLLNLMAAENRNGVLPDHLVTRVSNKLPAAIMRRSGHHPNTKRQTQDIGRERDELAKEAESLTQDIDRLEDQSEQLRSALGSAKSQADFAHAVASAARMHGLVAAGKLPSLPAILAEWDSEVLRSRPLPTRQTAKQRQYDVALSFAGEDRSIARELAHALRKQGIEVFYDEFAKYELWGKNLYDHLAWIYERRAYYCVLLVSQWYIKSVWTRLERQAMQAKALSLQREYILPVRLDDAEVPGLFSTLGYLSYGAEGTPGIVDAIVSKVRGDDEGSYKPSHHHNPGHEGDI